MRVLHLNLKRKWFDMILYGDKTEEYRDIKPYWTTRLVGKTPDYIRFRNGYSRDAHSMLVKCISLQRKYGKAEWGAVEGKPYYVLKLGAITEVSI